MMKSFQEMFVSKITHMESKLEAIVENKLDTKMTSKTARSVNTMTDKITI